MKREPVQSSALKSVGFELDKQLLQIELVTERIYNYKQVPEAVFVNLMKATSLGKYYNMHIKDNYDFDEVTATK